MRNLVEYPITRQEAVECLREASEIVGRGSLLGDVRPYILMRVVRLVEMADEETFALAFCIDPPQSG
jgi:hypothetical protein